jgi:hypothetical protein
MGLPWWREKVQTQGVLKRKKGRDVKQGGGEGLVGVVEGGRGVVALSGSRGGHPEPGQKCGPSWSDSLN